MQSNSTESPFGHLTHEPVTVMFTEYVKPDKTAEYEAWSAGVHSDAKLYSGFISVDIIRPSGTDLEYTTLMKFDNYSSLKQWRDSTALTEWLKRLPVLLIDKAQSQSSVGMQLWFDRPTSPLPVAEPPYWKSVVIGVICVYPLILILNWLLEPVTTYFPDKIALLVNVVVLSGLLTYPVMPLMTRLLKRWLYPHV